MDKADNVTPGRAHQLHSGNTELREPNYWQSLRGQLSVIFTLLFLTIAILGAASFWGLTESNEVSVVVQDRWLPNTRLLGDLNNFTSDYRTAEANTLLAASASELTDNLHDIAVLHQEVTRARKQYEAIAHDVREAELYRRFSATWQDYEGLAAKVTALSSSGKNTEAAALYRTSSRQTYDIASDLLGQLTDYNVKSAAQASERSVRAYRRATAVMMGGLTVAGLMLLFVISQVRRSVSGPLLDLGRAMRQLAANHTGIDVAYTGRPDEIGEMARAIIVFRGNAIELAQSQRGLAQQATMLEEKLAHEQHLTRVQNDFVTMIAHEFRTPLTQIDAQAQRLVNMKDRLQIADVNERAGRIRAAVSRIVRLMDNLMDTTRLTGGDVSLFFHPETVDLTALLSDVCRLHREVSPEAFILEYIPAGPVWLRADPKLLFQAVSNLVSNGIKYSHGQAKIKVRLRQLDDVVRIVITDEGIGIPEADVPNIFARYYRGRNVSNVVGTGVGLFFVSTVIGLHGGEVTVESREGKGSSFIVTIPKVEPDDVDPRDKSAPAGLVDRGKTGLTVEARQDFRHGIGGEGQ
jgi:signal transduction histidine kinase